MGLGHTRSQIFLPTFLPLCVAHLMARSECRPPAPKRGDLVAVVVSMCIKGLRLVTVRLPEKFSPIGLGTNRSSHIRVSTKFALRSVTKGRCSPHPPRRPSFVLSEPLFEGRPVGVVVALEGLTVRHGGAFKRRSGA